MSIHSYILFNKSHAGAVYNGWNHQQKLIVPTEQALWWQWEQAEIWRSRHSINGGMIPPGTSLWGTAASVSLLQGTNTWGCSSTTLNKPTASVPKGVKGGWRREEVSPRQVNKEWKAAGCRRCEWVSTSSRNRWVELCPKCRHWWILFLWMWWEDELRARQESFTANPDAPWHRCNIMSVVLGKKLVTFLCGCLHSLARSTEYIALNKAPGLWVLRANKLEK